MATTTQIRTSTKVRRRAFSLAMLLDWAAILVLGIGAIIMILTLFQFRLGQRWVHYE